MEPSKPSGYYTYDDWIRWQRYYAKGRASEEITPLLGIMIGLAQHLNSK